MAQSCVAVAGVSEGGLLMHHDYPACRDWPSSDLAAAPTQWRTDI
jgi:hypothetical protein